jgi:hypothetical protein
MQSISFLPNEVDLNRNYYFFAVAVYGLGEEMSNINCSYGLLPFGLGLADFSV